MKYTTADCSQAICNSMPIGTTYHSEPKWKRWRKYKDASGQVTRIFTGFVENTEGKFQETWKWVIETNNGLVVREGTEEEKAHFQNFMYGPREI